MYFRCTSHNERKPIGHQLRGIISINSHFVYRIANLWRYFHRWIVRNVCMSVSPVLVVYSNLRKNSLFFVWNETVVFQMKINLYLVLMLSRQWEDVRERNGGSVWLDCTNMQCVFEFKLKLFIVRFQAYWQNTHILHYFQADTFEIEMSLHNNFSIFIYSKLYLSIYRNILSRFPNSPQKNLQDTIYQQLFLRPTNNGHHFFRRRLGSLIPAGSI